MTLNSDGLLAGRRPSSGGALVSCRDRSIVFGDYTTALGQVFSPTLFPSAYSLLRSPLTGMYPDGLFDRSWQSLLLWDVCSAFCLILLLVRESIVTLALQHLKKKSWPLDSASPVTLVFQSCSLLPDGQNETPVPYAPYLPRNF